MLGPFDLDLLDGVGHRQAAEFIGLGADQRDSSASIVGDAAWVDCHNAELGTVGLLGPELVDHQLPALTLVPLPCRLLLGVHCFDGP